MSDRILVFLILFGLGIIMHIVGAILLMFYKKHRKRCTETVVGTIVNMAKERGRSSIQTTKLETTYKCGIYEYQYNGETYYSASTVSTTAGPKFGKQRVLFINPENPEDMIEKRFVTYLPMVIGFGIGAFLWVLSIILVICMG